MNWKIVALIEAVALIVLIYLIVTRRIGRPLSEAEAQYKLKRKEEIRLQDEHLYQEKLNELAKQEVLISQMKSPIILVSVSGGEFFSDPYNLCVQDGEKKIHTLLAERSELRQLPKLQALFKAAGWNNDGPWLWKGGDVLVS
jgi:hypothetical protein